MINVFHFVNHKFNETPTLFFNFSSVCLFKLFLGEYAKYYFHLRSMMSKLGMKENELAPLDVKGLFSILFYFPFFYFLFFYYHSPCLIIFYLCFCLFFFLFFFIASDLFDWLYSHELFFDDIPPLIILYHITLRSLHLLKTI